MESENNISINGDEARLLMTVLRTSNTAVPVGSVLDLYIRLATISQVQPPAQPAAPTQPEG